MTLINLLGAPDALLHVERRHGHGLVVDFGGVLIEIGGGLGAEVTVAHVEVERSDAVRAVGAGELHASGDAFGGVISHWNDCMGGTGD
jgi:hypothetical protein